MYRRDSAHCVWFVRGGWMAAFLRRRGYAGMCVGEVVLAADDLPMRWPHIYRHELVHAAQSRILGPLYLPLTLLGYAYGYLRCRPHAHDASPLEIWADHASGNAGRNAFLRARNGSQP